MTGMTTQLNLHADQPGPFRGLSAHYSGEGFSDMHFDVHAVPADEFETWVQNTRGREPTLNAASYAALARQSVNPRVTTFGTVEPDLFAKIVSLRLPPSAGPETEDEGAHQAPRVEP
jgi:cytochrome o ubiquinol oxidase subunit 2